MGNCVQSIQRKIAEREKDAQHRVDTQLDTRLNASLEEIEALITSLDQQLDELALQTAKVDNEITYITDADEFPVDRRKRALYKRFAKKEALDQDETSMRQSYNRALAKRVKFNRMERTLMELRSTKRIGNHVAVITAVADVGLHDLDNSAEVQDRINELATALEEANEPTTTTGAEETKTIADDTIAKKIDALMSQRKPQASSAKAAASEMELALPPIKPKANATNQQAPVRKSASGVYEPRRVLHAGYV